MKCDQCKADTEVLSTRHDASRTMIYRRRRCFNEHRFTTVEHVYGEEVKPAEDPPTIGALLRQIADALDKKLE